MRDKSGRFIGMCNINRTARNAFCLITFACIGLVPANVSAQIIGDIGANVNLETVGQGNAKNGFGLSAMRYEDKQRMKRLRERYLELNPRSKGEVIIYDVNTSTNETPSLDEILEEVGEEIGAANDAR